MSRRRATHVMSQEAGYPCYVREAGYPRYDREAGYPRYARQEYHVMTGKSTQVLPQVLPTGVTHRCYPRVYQEEENGVIASLLLGRGEWCHRLVIASSSSSCSCCIRLPALSLPHPGLILGYSWVISALSWVISLPAPPGYIPACRLEWSFLKKSLKVVNVVKFR